MNGLRLKAGLSAVAVTSALLIGGAPSAGAAAPSKVAFVGDSIGRDAESAVRAAVEPQHMFAYYHAVAAGSIPYHGPRLLDVVTPANGPNIVILEVGTGDALYETDEATFDARARDLLDDLVPHVTCIRWLDLKHSDNIAYPTVNEYTPGINRAIHRVVEDYPTVEYFHYDAWTRLAGNGYLLADRLHQNARGRVEMGRMVDQAVDSCDPALTSGPFWDVRDSYWAADDIAWMADEGIADGYPNHTYRAAIGGLYPTVTRAQMANFLWNLEGSPTGFPPHGWSDGPAWINNALRWLKATGVANGFGNSYRPADPVTRGQVANFLWKLAGSPTGFASHPWVDGQAWIDPALDWINAADIANGYGNEFRPNAPLTRAAMAHLLHAYATNPPPTPPPAAPSASPATTAPAPPSTSPNSTSTVPPATLPPVAPPPSTTSPTTSVAPTTVPTTSTTLR